MGQRHDLAAGIVSITSYISHSLLDHNMYDREGMNGVKSGRGVILGIEITSQEMLDEPYSVEISYR